jgi:hypothetical protein
VKLELVRDKRILIISSFLYGLFIFLSLLLISSNFGQRDLFSFDFGVVFYGVLGLMIAIQRFKSESHLTINIEGNHLRLRKKGYLQEWDLCEFSSLRCGKISKSVYWITLGKRKKIETFWIGLQVIEDSEELMSSV